MKETLNETLGETLNENKKRPEKVVIPKAKKADNDPSTSPAFKEQRDAYETLTGDLDIGEVIYGGEKIKIKKLSLEATLFLVKISTTEKKKYASRKIEKLQEGQGALEGENLITLILDVISGMEQKDILKTLSLILRKDEKWVDENFSIESLLDTISALLQVEDIKSIVFRLTHLMKSL